MTNTEQSTTTPEAVPADPPPESVPASSRPIAGYRPWQIPLFLAVVWLAYFTVQYDKPVHIDDTQYLYAARHLLEEPWCPLCHEINWQKSPVPAFQDLINPPAFMYLQAGWIALFGDSIRGLHLLSTLIAVLAAACGYLVARRFTRHALLASALVLFSPNVLPVANLMVDVPSLAMGLASVAVFISGVDRDRKGQAALGGLLAGLALLTKYNAVVLLPLLALYAVLRRRPRYIVFLAIPVGMMGLWCVHNLVVYGELHLAITATYEAYEKTPQRWWENVYAALLVPGSTFAFLGVLLSARVRFRGFSIWGPLGALALLGPTQMWWWRPAFPAAVYWAFAINTIMLVAFAAGAARRPAETPETRRRPPDLGNLPPDPSPETTWSGADERRRDDLFLWLWIGGVTLFQVLFAYHQAPRYHILAFLPFALLLVRTLEAAEPTWRRLHYALAWGSVGIECLVALFVAAADDAHARANRDFPTYVERRFGSDDGRVFCVGHWGLQFYCEEQGFLTFDAFRGDVRKDDLLIVPSNNYLANLPKSFRPLPEGTPVCDRGPLFDLVQVISYPQDRTVAPLSPTEGFFGSWLLGRLHRAWPFSVSPLHSSSLYATRMPSLPYSWQPRDGQPDERFLLLRARCDYAVSTEKLTIDFASLVDRIHMVAGWGPSLPSDAGVGVWNDGPASRLEVVLDHRHRPYRLRVTGMAVRLRESRPVRVAVTVNGRPIGDLVFAPELSDQVLSVPAGALVPGENAIVFVYHLPRPIGDKALFFLGIELSPLTP